MRNTLLPLVFVVALTSTFAGCGQKGPLYLPQEPAAPAAASTTSAYSHGQPASKPEEERKDPTTAPSQHHNEQQSEPHTEAEAVNK